MKQVLQASEHKLRAEFIKGKATSLVIRGLLGTIECQLFLKSINIEIALPSNARHVVASLTTIRYMHGVRSFRPQSTSNDYPFKLQGNPIANC